MTQGLRQPPNSITGAEITGTRNSGSVGVDWLEFTVHGWRVEDVQRTLRPYIGGEWVPIEAGMLGYRRSFIGVGGARILYDATRESQGVHVILPGKCCAGMDSPNVRGVLLWVRTVGRITRLDLRWDDAHNSIEPRELWARALQGEAVSHCSRSHLIEQANRRETVGSMFTLGKRGSRQYLRVYKKIMPDGSQVTRWELEMRRHVAEQVGSWLVTGRMSEIFAERLVSFLDFREVGNLNTTRRQRSAWFVAIVRDARSAPLWLPVQVQTLESLRKWFNAQVAPTLALLVAADGGDMEVVYDAIKAGRARWKPRHRMLLAGA